jgi:hypothetical protein
MRNQDREVFPEDDEYIRVRITKGKDTESVKIFQKIFSKLLYIYSEKESEIVDFYKTFIPDFGEIIKIQKTLVIKKDLKRIVPDLFLSNYTRKCLNSPDIITEQEAREITEKILGSNEDFKKWDRQVSDLIRQATGTSEQDIQNQQQIIANAQAQQKGIQQQQQSAASATTNDISNLRKDLGIELFGSEREARRAGFLSEQVQQPVAAQQQSQKQILTNLDPEKRKQFLQQWTALQKQLADKIISPDIQSKIQSKMLQFPMIKDGQQILVDKLMDKARQTINDINADNLKQKYKSNIDAYFKSKKLTPEEEEKQINDPEFQKEMVKTIKAAFKPAYIQQLETLKKQNPVLAPKVDKAIQELEQIAPGSLAA